MKTCHRVPLVSAICALFACSVDDRQLVGSNGTIDEGQGGSSSVSSGGSGSGGGGGAGQGCNPSNDDGDDSGMTGGSSGASPTSCAQGGTAGICPDLNVNNIPDNAQTLVQNSTFDSGIADWSTEFGVGLGWIKTDACGRSDSGSLSVTNQFAGTTSQNSVVGAVQCITVSPGRLYALMGNANPSANAYAGFGLAFHAAADCSDAAITSYNSPLITVDSQWSKQTTSGPAPDNAQSVAIRLLVAAPTPFPAYTYASALFDNVLVLTL